MSTIVYVSRALTFVAFMFNLLALWVPGWGSFCGDCTYNGALSYTCQYLGLFDWCISNQGLQTCYGCECCCFTRDCWCCARTTCAAVAERAVFVFPA